SAASASTLARPMPCAAAVTRMVLFFSRTGVLLCGGLGEVRVPSMSNASILIGLTTWPIRETPSFAPMPFQTLEPQRLYRQIAARAAQQAKRKDVAAIRDAIELMQEDTERGIAPTAGDREFHGAIAQAAGNAVLVDTVRMFWDARRGPLFERLGDYFENVPSW